MSESGDKEPSAVKKSIAARLSGATAQFNLPDEVKEKIRQTASSLGKSEAEVYQEIIVKGLASTSEDVAYLLARKKVIDSLSPSEHIQVLKNVEAYMRQVQSIFGTWKDTPTPTTVSQPTTPPTENQPVSEPTTQATSPQGQNPLISPQALDQSTKAILKILGLPDITLPQAHSQGQTASPTLTQGHLLTLAVAKMAIDKLGGTAVTALMNNPKIQDAIANLITKAANDPQLQKIMGGLLDELSKLMGGGEKPPS